MPTDIYSNNLPQGRLDVEQLRALGRNGYVVVPSVVESDLIDAALQEIDCLVSQKPPPPDHTGHLFFWCDDVAPPNPLLACLTSSPAFTLAESAIAPNRLNMPTQIQVSLNLPPKDHRPGGPHLDGLTPPEPDGRPSTFTLLAGLFLTDQMAENMGNLWVWPGTHLINATHFREQGGEALLAQAPYPPTELPEPPIQVVGRAGDMLLAHYLLGHNMGGNLASSVRKVIYFRLRAQAHREHWQACIKDTLFEFAPIRAALRQQVP